MKKFALLASLVATVAFGSVLAGTALANDPTIIAESKGFACGVFDRDGSIFITENSRAYLLANGKEVLHCIGQGTPGDTIVNFNGFACGMVFTGISTDPLNKNKVSRLGQSQLWCYGQAVDDAAAGPAGALG